MSDQRMYTVAATNSLEFTIVWTRGAALARSWAADKWGIDPALIDTWPTNREDQDLLDKIGQLEEYA
jgi:hypothetical protein